MVELRMFYWYFKYSEVWVGYWESWSLDDLPNLSIRSYQ